MQRQGTVDKPIEIQPSAGLRSLLLLLWAAGAALFAALHPYWEWAIQGLWAAAMWHWAASTCGVGLRPLRLSPDADGWRVEVDGRSGRLLGLRRGIVGPRLVTAVLQTSIGSYAVMASADANTPEMHWRLRRLMIEGVPQQVQSSLGRGT
jgi:hypothetical protein